MIVGGQTEARAQLSSTIIDYHEPFDQGFTVRTEKTRLVRYLFYLYCVSEGLRNDSYSRETASNFWRTSKAKRFNLKSFLSR